MPEGAQKATRLTSSNYIPKILVTTADGSGELAAFSYEELREDARDAARDLADKLEEVNVLGSGSGEEATTDPETTEPTPAASKEPLSYPRQWTNAAGKTITAGVNRIEGGNVIFDMAGKEVSYPLSDLSEESRKEIEALEK